MGELNEAANATKTTVSAVGQIIDIAKTNPDAREAGANLAKTAKVLTEFISNLALPLAAGNFVIQRSADYFRNKFGDRLGEKLAGIDPDDLQPPKPVIAGPAIEGLNYAHDEPELEDMFTSLIASSMDKKTAADAHPAYVDVIRQLDPAEAKVLQIVLRGPVIRPLAELRTASQGWTVLERNILQFVHRDTGALISIPSLPVWVDNWVRLGLVEVDWMSYLSDPAAYEWVERHPHYLRLEPVHPGIEVAKATFRVSDFGQRFARAVRATRQDAGVAASPDVSEPLASDQRKPDTF